MNISIVVDSDSLLGILDALMEEESRTALEFVKLAASAALHAYETDLRLDDQNHPAYDFVWLHDQASDRLCSLERAAIEEETRDLLNFAGLYIKKYLKTREDILDYIKHGRGYSDPTDLFEHANLPEVGEFDDDTGEPLTPWTKLYSREGAIALMDAAIDLKNWPS